MKSAVPVPAGLHVGVIMDGNGRWAMARGQPRFVGHRVAVQTDFEHVEGTLLSCTPRSAWIVSDDEDHVVALPNLRLVQDIG